MSTPFDRNVATMAKRWPGADAAAAREGVQVDGAGRAARRGRAPRVLLRHGPGDGGHGRGRAGDDLLLANEVLDLTRLTAVDRERRRPDHGGGRLGRDRSRPPRAGVPRGAASTSTSGSPAAAATPPTPAAWPTWPARKGLEVRGVMGYEGHLMREPGDTKAELVERSMALLLEAHDAVGGDVISGGGTGTWDAQHLGHRAPGRLLLPHGHRVHAARRRASRTPCSCRPP